jgi:hypothetical protein
MKSKFPKHQTVEFWIKELKEFDPKLLVKLADGPGTEEFQCMLSIYQHKKTVFIDIGLPNAD